MSLVFSIYRVKLGGIIPTANVYSKYLETLSGEGDALVQEVYQERQWIALRIPTPAFNSMQDWVATVDFCPPNPAISFHYYQEEASPQPQEQKSFDVVAEQVAAPSPWLANTWPTFVYPESNPAPALSHQYGQAIQFFTLISESHGPQEYLTAEVAVTPVVSQWLEPMGCNQGQANPDPEVTKGDTELQQFSLSISFFTSLNIGQDYLLPNSSVAALSGPCAQFFCSDSYLGLNLTNLWPLGSASFRQNGLALDFFITRNNATQEFEFNSHAVLGSQSSPAISFLYQAYSGAAYQRFDQEWALVANQYNAQPYTSNDYLNDYQLDFEYQLTTDTVVYGSPAAIYYYFNEQAALDFSLTTVEARSQYCGYLEHSYCLNLAVDAHALHDHDLVAAPTWHSYGSPEAIYYFFQAQAQDWTASQLLDAALIQYGSPEAIYYYFNQQASSEGYLPALAVADYAAVAHKQLFYTISYPAVVNKQNFDLAQQESCIRTNYFDSYQHLTFTTDDQISHAAALVDVQTITFTPSSNFFKILSNTQVGTSNADHQATLSLSHVQWVVPFSYLVQQHQAQHALTTYDLEPLAEQLRYAHQRALCITQQAGSTKDLINNIQINVTSFSQVNPTLSHILVNLGDTCAGANYTVCLSATANLSSIWQTITANSAPTLNFESGIEREHSSSPVAHASPPSYLALCETETNLSTSSPNLSINYEEEVIPPEQLPEVDYIFVGNTLYLTAVDDVFFIPETGTCLLTEDETLEVNSETITISQDCILGSP